MKHSKVEVIGQGSSSYPPTLKDLNGTLSAHCIGTTIASYIATSHDYSDTESTDQHFFLLLSITI